MLLSNPRRTPIGSITTTARASSAFLRTTWLLHSRKRRSQSSLWNCRTATGPLLAPPRAPTSLRLPARPTSLTPGASACHTHSSTASVALQHAQFPPRQAARASRRREQPSSWPMSTTVVSRTPPARRLAGRRAGERLAGAGAQSLGSPKPCQLHNSKFPSRSPLSDPEVYCVAVSSHPLAPPPPPPSTPHSCTSSLSLPLSLFAFARPSVQQRCGQPHLSAANFSSLIVRAPPPSRGQHRAGTLQAAPPTGTVCSGTLVALWRRLARRRQLHPGQCCGRGRVGRNGGERARGGRIRGRGGGGPGWRDVAAEGGHVAAGRGTVSGRKRPIPLISASAQSLTSCGSMACR